MPKSDAISALLEVVPQFEGNISHMYLDTAGLVTAGIGHMIPHVAAAQQIPFVVRATGAPAAVDHIAADYRAVAAAQKGQPMQVYQRITACILADGWAIRDAAFRLRNEFFPLLSAAYPDLDTYPLPAQVALLDMIYNLGAAGLAKFRHLHSSIEAKDWAAAARQCHRMGIQASRNEWTAQQFMAAAGVNPAPGPQV